MPPSLPMAYAWLRQEAIILSLLWPVSILIAGFAWTELIINPSLITSISASISGWMILGISGLAGIGAFLLATCRWYSLWLYRRNGIPTVKTVYHATSKETVEEIKQLGIILPGSSSVNLGSGVYVGTDKYWAWTVGVSVNERWPIIHRTKCADIRQISIDVRDPTRLIWSGPDAFVVRKPICHDGTTFFI